MNFTSEMNSLMAEFHFLGLTILNTIFKEKYQEKMAFCKQCKFWVGYVQALSETSLENIWNEGKKTKFQVE